MTNSTSHHDFFGKELFEGDVVALLQKSGSSSVYIRKGTIVGSTPKQVRVQYRSQGTTCEVVSTRDPSNVIKK